MEPFTPSLTFFSTVIFELLLVCQKLFQNIGDPLQQTLAIEAIQVGSEWLRR